MQYYIHKNYAPKNNNNSNPNNKIYQKLEPHNTLTMDIQPNQSTNTIQPKFSFTQQLTHALKWIQQKDTIQSQNQYQKHKPRIQQRNIDGTFISHNSQLARMYQTRDLLIFVLVKYQTNFTSVVTIYSFGKANGENQSKQIHSIKGKIVSIQFSYPYLVQNTNNTNNTNNNNKNEQLNKYQLRLVMGNQDGFIKIIDFNKISQIQSFQIDTKSIVDIKIPNPQYFKNQHICITLILDYSIYILSIQYKTILAHFRPTIMMCDKSLNLSLHYTMKYMLQTTCGGYIVLWKINQNLFKKLQNKQLINTHQKIYNIFPTNILHSASIQGIKWATFIGDFIALITSKGIFKIIALNIQQKQQYASILQYPIQNGQYIKDVKLLAKQQCIIVIKPQNSYSDCIECIFYSPQLVVTSLFRVRLERMPHIDQILLSKNKKYIFLRNKNKFYINFMHVFEQKIMENKRNNDQFRTLNY